MGLKLTRTNSSRNKMLFGFSRLLMTLICVLAIAWCAQVTPSHAGSTFTARMGQGSSSDQMHPASNGLPGDLDLTFGLDGTMAADLGNNLDDSACAVALQPDGRVVAAGYATTSSNGKDFALVRLNQNGTLDTTFGNGGKLSFDFSSATRDDVARAVAIQPDGKIVVAGEADVLGFGNFDIVLARLNGDGALDSTFGTGGKVRTNLPNDRADFGRAVLLQPDGKILVAGYSNRPTTGDDFVVVRYNSNGSLDTTFDGDGIVTTDLLTNREDRAAAIALQSDGKIVAAGYTNDPSFKNNFAVVRYNTNGSLDSTFNGTGKVTTDVNLNSDDIGNAVTLQSDGRIVVAGQSSGDFGLVRYNSNGSLDSSFGGGDGITTTNFGSGAADTARGVVVQADGKIIVAGKSRTELALARYNSDGTLDNSFDKDGLIVQNAGNNQLSAFGGYWGIVLQTDGKIVAAGDGWRDFSGNDFAVSRLNPNGTFDFSFGGGDGIASTDINDRVDEARSVALQPDGKIVVAGGAQNSTGGFDFAVARYNPNGTLDTSFGGDGIVITDIQGHGNEGAYGIAIQPNDGKILVAGYTNDVADGLVDDGALIRYNSNGTLDATFGNGGISILTGKYVTKGGLAWMRNKSIALQPDGKIVIAGEAHYFSAFSDGFVARYNASGLLDTNFGVTVPGVSLVDASSLDTFNAVAIQTDGKIVAAGSVNDGPAGDFYLARLNSNGALDISFDGDGKLTTDFGNSTFDAAHDVKIQPDGKIIAVGQTDINFIDMAAARYNPNGSLDTTFGGGDGKLNIDFNTWGDVCSAVALQPDGKIILGGVADLSRNFSGFAVAKLTSSGAFDTSFGNGTGRVITNLGEGVNTGLGQVVNAMALQSDGNIVLVGASNFDSTDRDFTLVRYENPFTGPVTTPTGTNVTVQRAGVFCTFSRVTASGNTTLAPISPAAAGILPSGYQLFGGSVAYDITTTATVQAPMNTCFSMPTVTDPALFGQLRVLHDENGSLLDRTVTQNFTNKMICAETASLSPFVVAIAPQSQMQFNATSYTANEGDGGAAITVSRLGDTSSTVKVSYSTSNGTANGKSDYIAAIGTITFGPGVMNQTVPVLIIDNAFVDGDRTVNLNLSNPSGAPLGTPTSVTLTIHDNDSSPPTTNPLDKSDARFFVRENYLDFLSRQPDPAGLTFWANEITSCGADQQCVELKHINVSAAFYLSIEFQQTGFLVERIYKVAYGDATRTSTFNGPHQLAVPVVRLDEFLPDTQQIGKDVVVGQAGWEQALENNVVTFTSEFVQRPRFSAAFPQAVAPAQFVDTLNTNAGGPLSTAERNQLVLDLTTSAKTRAQVLRAIAEDADLKDAEFNRAFVLMQFFGYLRRNPNDAPDADYSGYDFWLTKLSQFNGNFVNADMVKAFIVSSEYRHRFGP